MRSRSVGSPDATRAVDWEQRIDFPRLRQERLDRAKAALEASDLGALLLFDPNNIRYVTSTHIGEWARDKNARFALLKRGADPILWDFGSAARHHQLFAPWLPPENFRAGVSPMRGAMPNETGIPDRLGERIAHELREDGLLDDPLGIDMSDLVTIEALQRAGVHITDGSQVMLAARKIKTDQEIALLDQSAGLVDAVYEEIYEMLRPGVYEHEIVAPRTPAALRDGLRAGRGRERRLGRPLQPAPARVLGPAPAAGRPGVLRHHPLVHGLPDVLLPHVQRRRREPVPARCLQAVPRVAGRGHRARPAGDDHRQDRRGLADRRGARASRTRRRASASSSATGSASGSTSRR